MTKTRIGLALGALATVLATACGGGGSSTPLTEDQFCDQKAQKECQVTDRCGLPSKDTCLAQRKATCLSFAAASKVAPRVFHPENVPKCIDRTGAAYAKGIITPADLADMNDACSYVFQGNVDKFGTCTVKYDCKGTFICDKGLCADRVEKAAGQPCGNAGEICVAGQYCTMTPTVTALTCNPKKAKDAVCDPANPCVENLRCSGTCMALVAAAGACASDSDCAPAAPYCDPYSGNKCEVGLVFAPTAAAACAAYGGTAVSGTGGASGGTGGATGGTGGMDGSAAGTGGSTGSDAGDAGGGDGPSDSSATG